MTETKNGTEPVATGELALIPLDQLVMSRSNVRRTGLDDAIVELANSIAERGLLQNLVVQAGADGKYEVIGGGRRHRALCQLAEQKRIPWDRAIACRVEPDLTAKTAIDVSLTENVQRLPLNAVDEAEAYAASAESGSDIKACATRFGVTERRVRQRLKLAALSEEVKEAGRKGILTIEMLEAFTVTADHSKQTEVLATILNEGSTSEHEQDDEYVHYEGTAWTPRAVRRILTEGTLTAASPKLQLVGIDAYEKAGGHLERDLFTMIEEDDEEAARHTYIADPEIVERLLEEKLDEQAALVREQNPWKWVETRRTYDANEIRRYGFTGIAVQTPPEVTKRLTELEAAIQAKYNEIDDIDPDDENNPRCQGLETERADLTREITELRSAWKNRREFSDTEVKISGCLIFPFGNEVAVTEGLVRPEDADEVAAMATDSTQTADESDTETPGVPDDTESATEPAAVNAADGDASDGDAGAKTGDDAPMEEIGAQTANHERLNYQAPFDPSSGWRGQPDRTAETPNIPDPQKIAMKSTGLTAGNASILRGWRKNVIIRRATGAFDIMAALVTYQIWTTSRPGRADVPPGTDGGPLLTTVSSYRETEASRKVGKADADSLAATADREARRLQTSGVALDWLDEPDPETRFKALLALPPAARRRLFAIGVASWIDPQIAIDSSADGALEAAIEAMNINWSTETRPDAAHWSRVPLASIRETIGALLPADAARQATVGRKADVAAIVGEILTDQKGPHWGAVKDYAIPGLAPGSGSQTSAEDAPDPDREAGTDPAETAGEANATTVAATTPDGNDTPKPPDGAKGAQAESSDKTAGAAAPAETTEAEPAPPVPERSAGTLPEAQQASNTEHNQTPAETDGPSAAPDTEPELPETFDRSERTQMPGFLADF